MRNLLDQIRLAINDDKCRRIVRLQIVQDEVLQELVLPAPLPPITCIWLKRSS